MLNYPVGNIVKELKMLLRPSSKSQSIKTLYLILLYLGVAEYILLSLIFISSVQTISTFKQLLE